MYQTPLAHDAASAAYDATQTFVGQMYILAAYSGMDGKVVHSLFALFDQCIFINLPIQILYFTVYFL